jgi:hypothetical protein
MTPVPSSSEFPVIKHLPPNHPTRFPTVGDKTALTRKLKEMTLDKRIRLNPKSCSIEGKNTPKPL